MISWLKTTAVIFDIGSDNALLYLGLSSSSSILFLAVAVFEAAFDMGLLSSEHLQSPKLHVSGPMLLPTGVKDGQFGRVGLFRRISESIHGRLVAAFDSTIRGRSSNQNFNEHGGYATKIV
jgi:hypothetical protein